MSEHTRVQSLARALGREVAGAILPYWMTRAVDDVHGGFVGFIGADEVARPDAPRGVILNARILWTFSAAHRVLGRAEYLPFAARAARALADRFTDPVHGGVYWMVEADGHPVDTRKHVYAQAFAIYALGEHARATGDAASLRRAIELYRLVERHAHDAAHGGYEEAFSRDWRPLDDVRLSEVDAPERKSMNTHLHVLEAYTNLHRVWPDAGLRARIAELLHLFLDHVVDRAGGHLRPFFDSDWTPRSSHVSYGHDIEASWLLLEAADVAGDELLRSRVRDASLALAAAVLEEAYDEEHGGIYYERAADGALNTDKEWWPQAEAIVGFLVAYEESGDEAYLRAAERTWRFVDRHVADRVHGEWFRRVDRAGAVHAGHEKVGPWKCPYHDARSCLEVVERAARIAPPVPAFDGVLR